MRIIDDDDLTFVMQGPVDGVPDIHKSVAGMRRLFPRARFHLASLENAVPCGFDFSCFDDYVLTADPGPLPSVKFGEAPHNVNRQITTSGAGLQTVTTRHAVKMRADSFVSSRKLTEFWNAWAGARFGDRRVGEDRILTVSFYTLNPRFDERIPFHISDWLQVGLTADLQRMWQCPFYDIASATFYETEPHVPGSLPRERRFRARFATEQWIALNYLYAAGEFPIAYHNDCSHRIIAQYENDLVDNFVVVHPRDIDLHVPKHDRAYRSRYANLRNYSYNEWAALAHRRLGQTRSLRGFSQWPRTRLAKSLYMLVRRKRRLNKRSAKLPVSPAINPHRQSLK